MSQQLRSSKTIRKKKRNRRIVIWILTPLLVITLSAVAYGTFLYKKAESVANKSYKPVEVPSKRKVKANPKLDNVSILLMGIDDSQTRHFGKGTRTDALMVVTLNKKENSLKLLSIPRDSYVSIPGRSKKTKINEANAYGGTKLAIETVQDLLDIPIDYYVKMNFNAFLDVVKAIDGIDVNVPYKLVEQDSKDQQGAIRLQPGLQHLNAEEALALARTRHYDNDIQRGLRQQEIIKAIVKKAVSVDSIPKQGKIIDALGKNMETNLTFDDMKSLVSYAASGKKLDFTTLHLEGKDSTISGIYYYQLDPHSLANVKLELQTTLNINPESASKAFSNTKS
ncbi:LCP family protein [Neobacillus sp. SM06]|uniref:LCP family protein n=1 Tax=Neobacillus sp. SM06 TaxID=3422492 RepID=UPI003D291DCD